MTSDDLYCLIEDVVDEHEHDYFDGLIMYYRDFGNEMSRARHYLYPTLRERINEMVINSNDDKEKIILESLIHYLNALNEYYKFFDMMEKYLNRNIYRINKYGYEELNQILTYVMEELKKGKELRVEIDENYWFFDKNISKISEQIDWVCSNYEGNLKNQLRYANFKKKEIKQILKIKSSQERIKYIEKIISMREAECVKEKDLCNIYNKSRWLALIFLVMAFLYFNFTYYLLFAIISGLNIRFNSVLEEKDFFINSCIFAIGFIFAPFCLLNWFGMDERNRNICSKYKISELDNILHEMC